MITSDRKFGIEIEFISPNESSHNRIASQIPVVFDGSLRPHRFGGEWVSPPLSGKSGENDVMFACSVLKKNRADVNNPATSLHIHLDGRKDAGEVVVSSSRDPKADYVVGVSNAASEKIDSGTILSALLRDNLPFGSVPNVQKIDNTVYFSNGNLTRHPKLNYKFYSYKREDRSKWLRNVFYFYTKYTDVLQAMVSNSRRSGNMYCIPLSDSFELEEIEDCKNMEDIINVWYKGMGIGGHYDDSRYHNVNLHAFFNRHGTVEIRSHGATTDPNKILLWVRFHQYIVDKLETLELEDIKSSEDPFVSFLGFLSDDAMLQEYYKRLIGYFGGVIIKDGKVIRD